MKRRLHLGHLPWRSRWKVRWSRFRHHTLPRLKHDLFGACLGCGAWRGVELECSRTAYHWDGKGRNPNAPIRLCRTCAADHHSYWDEMWAMAHSMGY